jgi:hypothetical protein
MDGHYHANQELEPVQTPKDLLYGAYRLESNQRVNNQHVIIDLQVKAKVKTISLVFGGRPSLKSGIACKPLP